MIKKFKEYISESIIISVEELEDQFLRFKEVFDCDISIILFESWYTITIINYRHKKSDEVDKEINTIKRRIKSQYPNLKILFIKSKVLSNLYIQISKDDEKSKERQKNIEGNFHIRGDWKTLDYLKESVN